MKKPPFLYSFFLLMLIISLRVEGRPRSMPLVPLHLEEMTVPGLNIDGVVVSLTYVDGKLVFGQFKGASVFIVADLQDGHCFSAVREGRGPGEVIRPDLKSVVPTSGGFLFYDAYGQRKATLSKESITVSTPQKHISIPHAMNGVVSFRGEYLDIALQGDREMLAYNSSFTRRREVGKFPKWRRDPSWLPGFAYGKHLVTLPEKDKLLLFYYYYPQIRIYTDVDKRPKDINMDYYGNDIGPRNVYYAVKPVAGKDYVLALTSKGGQGAPLPELQILDWDGQILARYELDRAVHGMAMDFESGTLYAYCDSMPNCLCKVRIPFLSSD